VAQTARNLVMDLKDAGCRVRHLIHNRDGKYPALFDAVLFDVAITAVFTGVRVPRTNSIMERWVRTCRHELLDRTLI
jgi:transposase InsO family protein